MKLISLLENTTQRTDLQTEHGLSLYLECANRKILFDMGQTDRFAQNAQVLGVDLRAVDFAVLSHGHYDHGGGLRTFLDINLHAPVYFHPDAFEPHYNGTEKYIGLDISLADSPRLRRTGEKFPLAEGMTLFSCNQNDRPFDPPPSALMEQRGDTFFPDDFRHEQYLLIEESGKRILLSGCSHKGIRNLVTWFAPDVLIGGFHFSKCPLDENLATIARELGCLSTEFYTCHCTGTEQFHFMREFMPNLHYLSCGQSLTL